MTYRNLFILIDEMYHLSRNPWPEPLKQILLKMTERFAEIREAELTGMPLIVPDGVRSDSGEDVAQLHEMVSWQDDPRFILFQSDFFGQGMAARGMARIGEPAFDAVVKSIEKSRGSYAIETVHILMENEDSYLYQDLTKQDILRNVLITAINKKERRSPSHAISALRHFPHQDTFTLLNTIIRERPGSLPMRRAQEALTHLQRQ